MNMKLGERLVRQSLVNRKQVKQALEIQHRIGGRLGDILLAITDIRAVEYYKVLGKQYHMDFWNLLVYPVDDSLLLDSEKDIYLDKATIPVQKKGDRLIVATSNPSPEVFSFIKEYWGENTHIVCTSRYDFLYTLQKRFSSEYLDQAINSLINANPALSSKYLLERWQLLFFIFAGGLAIYIATHEPLQFFIGVNYFLMIALTGVILYKILLSLLAFTMALGGKEKVQLDSLPNENLPIYSILIPLYRENEITLRNLFLNMQKLDYPTHLLDIKILLEHDDTETIAILKQLHLPRYFEFIYVPQSLPRTKAKACNYGLRFARGEYITLYDAEDKPDPLQLRIALQTFKTYADEKLVCVQSRLNFYNSNENWLTKMFTLEYTYWFDLLLPALEYLGIPIPLGGTSNHFKTSVLWELHAWDPYNVTEDADLGTRLDRMGYKTRIISSTTYEEANCKLSNWIRQRTRWIKGYMQTYLVHMRKPFQLWRSLGTSGFLGFQLFIGGTILANLSNLVLWLIFLLICVPDSFHLNSVFPAEIMPLAWINFIFGSLGMILLNMLSVLKRKNYKLLLVAFTAPLYWVLMSIASYRALYQLIFSPNEWEKTEHGLSKTLK